VSYERTVSEVVQAKPLRGFHDFSGAFFVSVFEQVMVLLRQRKRAGKVGANVMVLGQ